MSDLTQAWHYARAPLAATLGQRLLAHERIAMLGPRQPGKTTLLRDELIPYVQSRRAVAVYIDCWMDTDDPLQGINYALQKALDGLTRRPRATSRWGSTSSLRGPQVPRGDAPRSEPGAGQ